MKARRKISDTFRTLLAMFASVMLLGGLFAAPAWADDISGVLSIDKTVTSAGP